MEDTDSSKRSITINTSVNYPTEKNVSLSMQELRPNIQIRLRKVFEDLPPIDAKKQSVEKYVQENPQSVIFVPEKELNMFPVIVDEAKKFANDFSNDSKTENKVAKIREHEFEHLQKAYELDMDIEGIGFVIFKKENKPTFTGFIMAKEDEEGSLRDRLRMKLAPSVSSLSKGDFRSSQLIILKELTQARSIKDLEQVKSDTLFVFSERFLPKKVHNFLQKSNNK